VSTATVEARTRVRESPVACAVGQIGACAQPCPRKRFHACACVGAGVKTRVRGGALAGSNWATVVGTTGANIVMANACRAKRPYRQRQNSTKKQKRSQEHRAAGHDEDAGISSCFTKCGSDIVVSQAGKMRLTVAKQGREFNCRRGEEGGRF